MFRWMCGLTKLDRKRNEACEGQQKLEKCQKKVHGMKLKWYGHVIRREYVNKRMMVTDVLGKRRKEDRSG